MSNIALERCPIHPDTATRTLVDGKPACAACKREGLRPYMFRRSTHDSPFNGPVEPEPAASVPASDLPDPANTARELPKRSDGVVLFRTDRKYLVCVGKRAEAAAVATLDGFDNIEVLSRATKLEREEYEKRAAGRIVFYLKRPHGAAEYGKNKHALIVHGTGHGIEDLKGFHESIAADVDITEDGRLVFGEPSAWDMLPTDYLVVYDAVEEIVEETGKPAGVGRIGKEAGIARQTAAGRCAKLVGKGYLVRVGTKYRPAE